MKKKTWAFVIAVVMTVTLAACGSPADEKESSTEKQTVSFTAGNESESTAKSSGAESKKKTQEQTKSKEKASSAGKSNTGESSKTTEKSKKQSEKKSDQTGQTNKEAAQTQAAKTEQTKSESNPKQTEQSKADVKPETTQPSTQKPKEETPTPQPPKETEPEPTPQPEPAKPKSIYDYEFDIEAIRQELLAIGTGMGLQIDSNLTPDSSSWAVPVVASKECQGAALERSLKDYVRSMPDLITANGGQPIQYFTIYVESIGGGGYNFYFLY